MMTSREEHEALTNIPRLMRQDLSKLTLDELLAGARQAEVIRAAAPEHAGRLLAEAHKRGLSWAEIARLTGLSAPTAWRRAENYISPDEHEEQEQTSRDQ